MTIGTTGGGTGGRYGLGRTLLNWFHDVLEWWWTTPLGSIQAGILKGFFGAVHDAPQDTARRMIEALVFIPTPAAQIMATILTVMSGAEAKYLRPDWKEIIDKIVKDPRRYMQSVASAIGDYPPQEFYADKLGEAVLSVVLYPVTSLLESESGNPEEALRRVVGQIAAFVLAIHTIGLVAEVLGIGQIQSVAMALSKMVDAIDLQGWTREMTRPILRIGLYEFGRRYYNKRYRPGRWSVSELLQLYALRSISKPQLASALAEEGYRDSDIDTAISLAEKRVSAGDVLAALETHMITTDEAVSRLHDQGYGADAIGFTLRLQGEKQHQDDLNSISAIALSAFRKHVISEGQFRQMRAAARIPAERIDIEVQLATLTADAEAKDLSVGNIRSAYANNVIARVEADHYLAALNVDTPARQILLATWDEQNAPKVNRLNASTILSAYRFGLLERPGARERLISVGWTSEDANLMLDIQDARIAGAKPPPSEADVLSAFSNGLIEYKTAIAHLQNIGLSEAAAALDLRMATVTNVTPAKTLTKGEIINLYQAGVFTFEDALSYLIGTGFDYQTAQLVILANTAKTKKPPTIKEG